MQSLKVNTIYSAFMGECNKYGIGAPCTFVRLAGCNIRCYLKTKGILCDTPEALKGTSGKEMSIFEILASVGNLPNKLICLTGGEPLLQKGVKELLERLSLSGYHVVVETNGTIDISPYRHIKNVSFVVDFKCSSTGELSNIDSSNFAFLESDDFVKFVVDDEKDLKEVEHFCDRYITHRYPFKLALGLFWGSQISHKELLEFIKLYTSWGMPLYLNMQTHKMMCLYDQENGSESFKKLFVPKEL